MKQVIQPPVETEQRNSAAHSEFFHDAGEEYLNPPAMNLSTEEIAAINPENALEVISESYFGAMSEDRRGRVSTLTEQLKANDDKEPLTKPDTIICVPAAAHNESPETLDRMFGVLAAQDNAANNELFLFGNYPDSIGEASATTAEQNISEAVLRARQKYPQLSIRHMAVCYEEHNMGIGAVRKDMMDIVAASAIERGLDYTQPVMWVDADLTKMKRDSLQLSSARIRNEYEAYMYHMFPAQTIENLKSGGAAEQVAAHYELVRRKAMHTPVSGVFNRDYIEESGLGFTLGNYLAIGGVNSADTVNESTWLAAGFESDYENIDQIIAQARGINVRHLEAMQTRTVKYMEDARIFTSGRRLVAAAQLLINQLADTETAPLQQYDVGNSYNNFSHTEPLRSIAANNESGSITDSTFERAAELNASAVRFTSEDYSNRIAEKLKPKNSDTPLPAQRNPQSDSLLLK